MEPRQLNETGTPVRLRIIVVYVTGRAGAPASEGGRYEVANNPTTSRMKGIAVQTADFAAQLAFPYAKMPHFF